MTRAELRCEVCHDEPAVAVCAVPGVAWSAAYGERCLQAGAHPWWIMVGNTMIIGGLEHANGEWREMVMRTCAHLGKTMDEFERAVREEYEDI